MSGDASPPRYAALRRLAEFAAAAGNATRILAGARMTDGQALTSLPADAAAGLRDARARFGLPPRWSLRDRLSTVADVAVLEVCDGPDLVAVLKLARTPAGDAGLRLQQQTLQRLAGDPRLAGWRRLLPEVLAHGVVGARSYCVERAVPGTVGTALPDPGAQEAWRDAVRAVSELHRATGAVAVASRAQVDRWLEPGLSLIAEVPMLLGPARRHRLVGALGDRIRTAVEGRGVWLGRTHGDYFAGNLFFGSTGDVTGIIDWGQSREDDPALIDPMTLILAGRARAARRALGRVVRDLCRGVPLSAAELALLDVHRARCPADPLELEVVALLAWLRHMENNLLKSPRYRAHPEWVHSNLETVLTAAAR